MGHPFPYVGSGVAAARKTMWCMVRFAKAVPKPARAALVKGVPSPLAGYFDWKDKTLTFGNDDDSLQWVVRATYDHVRDEDDEFEPDPELPSDAMWKAFNAELDKWLVGIHKKHPIALVIKPIDDEYSTATDAWHDWSCERIGDVLPLANAIDDQTGRYVAQLWKSWVEAQPFAKQQKLVGALSAAAKKALTAHDALVAPTAPEREPERPVVDFDRVWRDCAAQGGPMRLEDAFTAAMIERGIGPGYSLSAHMSQLLQAKRTDDAIELARAVLASGAEFPTNWTPTLADQLIAAGRLDEAEPVVRDVVGSLESYKPEMLVTAMRYQRGARRARCRGAALSRGHAVVHDVLVQRAQGAGEAVRQSARGFAAQVHGLARALARRQRVDRGADDAPESLARVVRLDRARALRAAGRRIRGRARSPQRDLRAAKDRTR